jgi:stalled ribosome rescue protein Dom34
MTKVKYLGIWMDHSVAHLIEFPHIPVETESITSDSSNEENEFKGENKMHNKEQQQQGQFYKELGEVIKNYDEVLLFGPTNAKAELMNILKENHHFDNIKIEVQTADKMTDNQQVAFVNDYFSKH